MSELEKIIQNNRKAYDSDEPSDGHFDRFDARLDELHSEVKVNQPKVIHLINRHWWQVAAVIVILVGFRVVFHNSLTKEEDMSIGRNEAILSPELSEVEIYYTSLADERFDLIDKLVPDSTEGSKIKEMVDMEMSELDQNYGELIEEYKKNPDDDRIIDAIINNYRIKAEILDNIIIKLQELKNQKNENHEDEIQDL